MNFMRQSGDKPFFVYLPTNAAHGPMFAPEEDKAHYSDKPRTPRGFFGMITNFDTHMGRLMAFLEEEGLSENTILIYTSDNGSAAGWRFFNAGMKGGKMSPYDGGHRVPFFIRWPGGGLEGGKRHRPACRASRRLADPGRTLRTQVREMTARRHEPGGAIDDPAKPFRLGR